MGVHGLWRLLDASGKPVPLETLEGKVLAIDVSIWIHQVLQGYQDRRGNSVPNAHLLGLFHRICKLLYFKIKPVFVFDGGVPMLKKNTIASRKKQKSIAATKAQQMKTDLIHNLIKHAAVTGVLGSGKSENPSQASSSSAKNSDSSNDMFKLPDVPLLNSSQSDETIDDYEDSDSTDECELSPRKQSRWKGNIHTVDVTSDDFKALPADVRFDVLTDLKETRKQNSWGRLHEIPGESNQFSDYQMKRLLKRRRVQESLEDAEKEMGGKTMTLEELNFLMTEQGIDTKRNDLAFRIASDSNTRVIYIKDPKLLQRSSSVEESTITEVPRQSSQSNEPKVSLDSGNDETSIVTTNSESVIDNINEYAMDSDWESDDDVMMPTKSVEPSPLLTKKLFGKTRLNPAVAYMMEYGGLPQEDILALIEGDRKKIRCNKRLEPEVTNEKKPADDEIVTLLTPKKKTFDRIEDNNESNFLKLSSDVQDLVDLTEIGDTSITEKIDPHGSSGENIKIQSIETDDNASSVKPMLSDSDTDSDLVEIQDVPIPDVDFGLEIVVKSDEPIKIEDDMFADVFAKESIDSSDFSAQDLSSSFGSTTNAKFSGMDEFPEITKKIEITSPISSKESVEEPIVSIDHEADVAKPKNDTAEVADLPSVASTSRAENLNDQVAKFKPELLKASQEKLVTMQSELETEHSAITENIGKLERQATAVTDQMRLEAQDLLRLFGIPYIVAPMEAEAQCAYLESIELTDGTVTDDSDIWLFGGRCVYKNFFNNNKRVMQYKLSDIQYHYKLSRHQMIQLALLVGSDYTVGVSGIGPVTALEVLAAFPSEGDNLLTGLTKFSSWIQSGRSAGPGRAALRSKLRNVGIDRGFPSQAVVQAYMFPTVDESKESFTWGKPNLTLLADYTRQKFGWKKLKFEETMSPVVKKLVEAKSQKDIMSYFRVNTVPKSIENNMSKRVKKAVQRLGNGAIEEESNEDDDLEKNEISKKTEEPKRRRGKAKASTNQSVESGFFATEETEKETTEVEAVKSDEICPIEKKIPKSSGAGSSGLRNVKNVDEYIPQREKDKANALKKKLKAIEVFRKSKKGPGRTRRSKPVVQNITREANLSESSNDSS